MNISSTVFTEKERKTSGLPENADASLRKLSEAGERSVNVSGTTGTFVYLKARRGMKSGSTQEANEEWRPTMWTYLR